jgi:hypothetical protein
MIGPYEQHISTEYKSMKKLSSHQSPVTFYKGGKLRGGVGAVYVGYGPNLCVKK